MTLVTVEDALDDSRLRDAMSDELAQALEGAWHEAEEARHDVRVRRGGYEVSVSPHGDIDVAIITFGGFEAWVSDAGELALHVGPTHDPQTGQSVVELLGEDVDGAEAGTAAGPDLDDGDGTPRWTAAGPPLHWLEWSPRLSPERGTAPDITVDVETVIWAWRCDTCGVAGSDSADFDPTADPAQRRCQCGGTAERTPAVYCDSCDTLILLRSVDPDAPR